MKKNYQCFKNLLAITLATTLMIPTVAMAGGVTWETEMLCMEEGNKSFTVWGDENGMESESMTHEEIMKNMDADNLKKLKDARIIFSFDKDVIEVVEGDTGFMDYGAEYTVLVPRGTTVSLSTVAVKEMRELRKMVSEIEMYEESSGMPVNIEIDDTTKLSGSNAEVAYEFSYTTLDGTYVTSTIKVLADYRGTELADSYWGSEEDEVWYADAVPTASKVLVNGKEIPFQAYNIEGNNYFKLRDLAMALNGTGKGFSVSWDNIRKVIMLKSNAAYIPVGGELATPQKGTGSKSVPEKDVTLYVDGDRYDFFAYVIDGNTYFMLRDIGQLFDFGVNWNGMKKCIEIDTQKGYMS